MIDVRVQTEFANGHVKNATNIPLSDMRDVAQIADFEDAQNLYIHCASGYRSVIACSLFKRQGYHNLRNVLGGWNEIEQRKGIKITKEASILN